MDQELVERLKNEMIKCSDRHNKDLEQLRSQVHKDTQAKCNEIMRSVCRSVYTSEIIL